MGDEKYFHFHFSLEKYCINYPFQVIAALIGTQEVIQFNFYSVSKFSLHHPDQLGPSSFCLPNTSNKILTTFPYIFKVVLNHQEIYFCIVQKQSCTHILSHQKPFQVFKSYDDPPSISPRSFLLQSKHSQFLLFISLHGFRHHHLSLTPREPIQSADTLC